MSKRHFGYVCPNIVIKPTISFCNEPLCKKPNLDNNIQQNMPTQLNQSGVTVEATSSNLTSTNVNESSTEPILAKIVKKKSPGEDLNCNCSSPQDLNHTPKKSDVSWASNYLTSLGEVFRKPIKLNLSLSRKKRKNGIKKPTRFTRNVECSQNEAALLKPRPIESSLGSYDTEFSNPIQGNEQKKIGTTFENVTLLDTKPNLTSNSSINTKKENAILSTDSSRTFEEKPTMSLNYVQEPIDFNTPNKLHNEFVYPDYYKSERFEMNIDPFIASNRSPETKREDSVLLSMESSGIFVDQTMSEESKNVYNQSGDPNHFMLNGFEKDTNSPITPKSSTSTKEDDSILSRKTSVTFEDEPKTSSNGVQESLLDIHTQKNTHKRFGEPRYSKLDRFEKHFNSHESEKSREIKNRTIRSASYRSKLTPERRNDSYKNLIKTPYHPRYESSRTKHESGRGGYGEYKYDEYYRYKRNYSSKPYVHLANKYKWAKPRTETNTRKKIESPLLSEDIKISDENHSKIINSTVAKNMNTPKNSRSSDKNASGKRDQTTDNHKKTNKSPLKKSRATEIKSKSNKVDLNSKKKTDTETQNNTECKAKTDSKLNTLSSSLSILSPCSSKSNNAVAQNSCEPKQSSPGKSIVKVKENVELEKSTISFDSFDLRSKLSRRSLNHYFTKLRNTNVDSEINENSQMERENLIITVENEPEDNNVKPKEVQETDNVPSQSEKAVKYKKIQVVINVIYGKSEADTENESNDNETENCHVDISFLDDINVDDIVESLYRCENKSDFNKDIAEISDSDSVVFIENDNSCINDAGSTISISDSIEIIEDNLLDIHDQDTMDLTVANENDSPKNPCPENNSTFIELNHRALTPGFTKQDKDEILSQMSTIDVEDTENYAIRTQNAILTCQPTEAMANPIENEVTEHDEPAIQNAVICGPIGAMANYIITEAIEQRVTIINQQTEAMTNLEKRITEKDKLGIQNASNHIQILASPNTTGITEKDEVETQIAIICQPTQSMVNSVKTEVIDEDEIETPNAIISQPVAKISNTNKTEAFDEQTAVKSQTGERKIDVPVEETKKIYNIAREKAQARIVAQNLEEINENVVESLVNVKIESVNETNLKRSENENTRNNMQTDCSEVVKIKSVTIQNEDTMQGNAVQRVLHSEDITMKTESYITEGNSNMSTQHLEAINENVDDITLVNVKIESVNETNSKRPENNTHNNIQTNCSEAIKIKSEPNQDTVEGNAAQRVLHCNDIRMTTDGDIKEDNNDMSNNACSIITDSSLSRKSEVHIHSDISTEINISENANGLFMPRTGPNKELMEMLEERMSLYMKDSFSVMTLLHTGKFSKIFRCKDSKGKDYAAKLITTKSGANRSESGLQRENMLIKLQQDIPQETFNCVYIFDGFGFGNKWCILMEYYPNTLEEVLKRDKAPFHIDAIQQLSRQLITALLVLRNNNVVHSDIKPSHILINASKDKLKLCGFDAAHYFEGATLLPNVGTVNYRAPEVILGHSGGFSIDVWSTATVMYEMATHRKLFPGMFNNDILFKQMCTFGNIPVNMINTSLYKSNHFQGVRFIRRGGYTGQNFVMTNGFHRSNRLSTTIFGAYHTHWAINRTAQQKMQDSGKIKLFIKLLVRMLTLYPTHRIAIEFVFAHPFVFS